MSWALPVSSASAATSSSPPRTAKGDWPPTGSAQGGRAGKLRDAEPTAAGQRVGAVVCVRAKEMKEALCLAASNAEATAREIANHYAKSWTIEYS
jgi:hypothetical protein